MQTSRFQLGLIVTLAVALGFSFSSSDAIGYPSTAISFGESPVVSVGGSVTDSASETLFSASGQDVIVTDLALSSFSHAQCFRNHKTTLALSSGQVLAEFETHSSGSSYDGSGGYQAIGSGPIVMSFASGLRIQDGQSLVLSVEQTGMYGMRCFSSETASYGVRYTVGGYYAQP